MMQSNELVFTYRNWKGRVEERRAIPQRLEFKSTEWHAIPQWIMVAFDVEKQALRCFAMKDMLNVDLSNMQMAVKMNNPKRHNVACG